MRNISLKSHKTYYIKLLKHFVRSRWANPFDNNNISLYFVNVCNYLCFFFHDTLNRILVSIGESFGVSDFITLSNNCNLVWLDLKKNLYILTLLFSLQTNSKRSIRWWAAPTGPSRGVWVEAPPPNHSSDYASIQMDKMKLTESKSKVWILCLFMSLRIHKKINVHLFYF